MKLDGVVYVLLDATDREQQSDKSETDTAEGHHRTGDQSRLADEQSELVGELRDQIDWLRREVERKDTIIMQMAQRIPELEAPPETRDAPEMAEPRSDAKGSSTSSEDPQEPVQRRSWLYRFFFGP